MGGGRKEKIMGRRAKTIRFIMFLIGLVILSPIFSGETDACHELSHRDTAFWDNMYGQPSKPFLYSLEPIPIAAPVNGTNMDNRKGIEAFDRGDHITARQHFTEAIQKNPRLATPYHNLALTEYLIAYNGMKFEKASQLWQTAGQLEPDNPRYPYHRATVLSQGGRVDEAIEVYQELLRRVDERHVIYNHMGQVFEFKGETNMAVENFKKAVGVKSDYEPAILNLGRAYEKLDQLHDAEKTYQELLALNPKDADSHLKLGHVYESMGQERLAMNSYKQAIALRSDDPEPHLFLSRVYRKLGRTQEALEEEGLAENIAQGLNTIWGEFSDPKCAIPDRKHH
jgi:tetratricopeptide (TPR) repeat protein